MVAALGYGASGHLCLGGSPGDFDNQENHLTRTPRRTETSASLLNPASLKLQAPAVFDARFTTTKGDFVVEVTRAWSPRGADRFYNLVKYHFFDNAAFFRVLSGVCGAIRHQRPAGCFPCLGKRQDH